MFGVRSIQEYVQQIGRYRSRDATALCAAFLTDESFAKLYSSSFLSAVNPASLRRFINDLFQDRSGELTDCFERVCFRDAEQRYDVAESTLRTLLILLENAGFLRLDVDFNNRCVITPCRCDLVKPPCRLHRSCAGNPPSSTRCSTSAGTTTPIPVGVSLPFHRRPAGAGSLRVRAVDGTAVTAGAVAAASAGDAPRAGGEGQRALLSPGAQKVGVEGTFHPECRRRRRWRRLRGEWSHGRRWAFRWEMTRRKTLRSCDACISCCR